MAPSDITFTAGADATPPATTVVETIQQTGGQHTQTVLGGTRAVTVTEWTFTSAQTNTLLLTATAGQRIGILRVAVTNAQSSSGNPGYRVGLVAGATLSAASASGVTGIFSSHPSLAQGSGVVEGHGGSLLALGADGDDVRFTCDNPIGTLRIVITSVLFNA